MSFVTPESSKKRTLNFSNREVDLLINLVGKYKHIIECKKSDRISNNTKTEMWQQLGKEFNSMSGGVYRDAKILKNKYENIKKRSKQKFADEKVYREGTGGGPDKHCVITDIDEKLKDIIGTQMTGRGSEFDADRENLASTVTVDCDIDVIDVEEMDNTSQTQSEIVLASYDSIKENVVTVSVESTSYLKNYSATTSCPLTPVEVVTASINNSKDNSFTVNGLKEMASGMETSTTPSSFIKDNSVTTNIADWSKYIPSQLRTPKSVPLRKKLIATNNKENINRCSSQSQLSQKVVTWASSKTEIATEQLKFRREEHELKLKLMREKHEWEMAMAKEEMEERRRYFIQKAELELEILRQQLQK